ncbi:MAG: PKD domain-containing protein, partial [Bacteroidetes bacterium]|nr:PKD domain-containing protein [Bacteroidota bacterium]
MVRNTRAMPGMGEHYAAFFKPAGIARCLSNGINVALCMAAMLIHGTASGQAFSINNGGTSTCTGAFLDSGGQGASGYSNNENYTYTICPDAAGGAISLNFITFNLSTAGAAPIDAMSIYDGNSTAAPLLGTWTGTSLQGQVVSASAGNSTGCLTVVFQSNNAGTGVFAATITCYQPCTRPTALANNGPVSPLKICPGEAVSFDGSGSYAATGFNIANRTWDFGDGTVVNNAPASVSHTYAQPGAYTAQLYLEDNNGCASTNRVDLLTLVGTAPNFNGTTGANGCSAESLCLNGVVNPTTWNETPDPDLGGGVFLPDNVGDCFSTTLTFSQFAPGQTLTNVNQLLDICVNMEHSFMGDLIIQIISPTGQTVVLHQQGGGGTYLGIPVDNDATPNIQGTCWNYCWSPSATNGTWAANAGGTLPSGTYESVQPLSGLVGSQLNGTWTFQVCDMWGIDNGFICDWGLSFDPSIYPGLVQFTPVYGAGCDSSFWSGPNITSTSANCDQICTSGLAPGDHLFTYTVTDDFGCTYDTTVNVTIVPDLQVDAGPDATSCGSAVQLSATVGNITDAENCDYVLWLYDSFGDGWNANGYVTITVDGVATSWTLLNGSSGSTTISVPDGALITLDYNRGGALWANEQSFTLLDASGGVAYTGNNPPNGQVWSGVADCPGGAVVYSWSPAAGLSDPNIPNPTASPTATTQYCVTAYVQGSPDCAVTDCLIITVDNPVGPGTTSSISVCGNGATVDLYAALGGTHQPGGTWSAPDGMAHGGTFIPGTDPGGLYSYAETVTGPCGTSVVTSTVDVTVVAPPIAGTDGAITLCSNGTPIDLFAQLGGTPDAGGTWAGPSAVAGGMFDPASMSAGAYTYTVAGTAPCADATATVTVIINTPPDAGTDGAITLCSDGVPVDLFGQLGGTPDAGGAWSGPSAVAGGQFDPATMLAGTYTYTVVGVAPCADASANVAVTINTPPNAGSDGAIKLCSNGAPVDLFAQLGGTPVAGGAWSGPSAVTGGQFDPATMTAGTYTYTVAGVAPCMDASANVAVTINTPPNAGSDGAITLCSDGTPVDLFAQLGGTPEAGGAWSGPSAVTGGQFDPATMTAGTYTYTVAGVAPCVDASANVAVTINTPPNAGSDGAITLCSDGTPVDLFAQLGGTPEAGGAWSGPSAVTGGQFDPATMTAGTYTYTVAGVAPCADASANVAVTINTPPNAGSDGALTLCSNGAPVDLFAQLGGTPDAGGAWSGPSAMTGGQFDPATMTAGTYTYTVAGVAPCADASANVAVTINTPPDAGTDGAITLCSNGTPIDLFGQLGGTPDVGGTWAGPSAVAGGMFDPTTMAAGAYIYTVGGTAPCMDAGATVVVSVNALPNAGSDGALTLCISSPATSLFAALGGSPDAG